MAQVKGVTLTIGGKRFVQESPTFEQDMFIMEQAVTAGLDEAVLELTPDGKDLERGVKQMLIQAYKRGTLFLLMASLMVEEGTEWSEEQARRNADIFRKCNVKEEKAQLHPALVGALLAFFESGVNLKKISSISSGDESPDAVSVVTRKPVRKPVLSPEAAAALFNSGRMDQRSARSRSTSGKSRKTSSP